MDNSFIVPVKNNPVLIDRVLQEIQSKLMDSFSWLDVAYGRACRRSEHVADRVKTYPAVYTGQGEYHPLFPDDTKVGFSWFDLYDPQEVLNSRFRGKPSLRVEGALVIWYRLDKIFGDDSALYTEEIKNDVLKFLLNPSLLSDGSTLEVKEVYENIENIYKGYGIKEWNEEFFTYPYAGLRIEITLKVDELCN